MYMMWKGLISFGFVNILVKFFVVIEDKDIKFCSFYKEDYVLIKYEKICIGCEKSLEFGEIVKGYEYVKGKYVILIDEDLKDVKQEYEEKVVEIVDFVQL